MHAISIGISHEHAHDQSAHIFAHLKNKNEYWLKSP